MNHPTFPKISTSFLEKDIAIGEWVVTEKIHGAHLVLAASVDQVCIGKRKSWLSESDTFFGWQLIAGELRERAHKLVLALGNSSVVIYGELCGGAYPHEDISAVPGLSAVQTGVWYSPHLQFVVFDIMIKGEPSKGSYFLSYDQMISVCSETGFITAPLLARGKKVEFNQLPITFDTKLPTQFNLPPINNNFAEGYVLKPAFDFPIECRPLVKRKIPEFDETRFYESRAFDPNAHLSFEDLKALCSSLVNDARIASARSKVGEASDKIIDEVVLDVLVDMEATFSLHMAALDQSEVNQLQTTIHQAAIRLI